MGYLHYGESHAFAFDDRTLTHLRTVILGKLNLQESLVLTWLDEGRQRSVWLHPTIPLQFEFEQDVTPELNPEWVEQLRSLANSLAGLRLVEEAPRSAPEERPARGADD